MGRKPCVNLKRSCSGAEAARELVGTVDQMVEDLIERRRRWGVSYIVIFEAYIDAFAPVIARLSGK
jgi:hypothetical protein